jgi:LacI family transcriptional regulator
MVEACRPPLSSVDMNLRELGAETGRRMVQMIRGTPQSGTIRLPCSLVLRDSA